MKKIIGLLSILVFSAFFFAYGGAITAPTVGTYQWELIDSATNIYATDSVKGEDTSILFSYKAFTPGYRYAVSIRDSVGAADTITLQAFTYISHSNGTYTYTGAYTFDTLEPVATSSSNYRRAAMAPMGGTAPCTHFRIGAVGWISAKVAKIRKAYLWAGRTIAGTYQTDEPRKLSK